MVPYKKSINVNTNSKLTKEEKKDYFNRFRKKK